MSHRNLLSFFFYFHISLLWIDGFSTTNDTYCFVKFEKKRRTKQIFRKYWRILYFLGWEWFSKRFDIQLTFRFALINSVAESVEFNILEHFGHKCAFQKSHQRDLQITHLKMASLLTVFSISTRLKYSAPINYIDGDLKKYQSKHPNLLFQSRILVNFQSFIRIIKNIDICCKKNYIHRHFQIKIQFLDWIRQEHWFQKTVFDLFLLPFIFASKESKNIQSWLGCAG